MISVWYQAIRRWALAHWTMLRRIVITLFALAVIVLLVLAVLEVDWRAVARSLRALPAGPLWLAAGITLASYLLYGSFDLLGRWYTGHSLAWWRPVMVGFVSYAFTMSLGTPVGALGMRLRLYSKQGLPQGVTMRVLAVALTTNWVGYMILTGLVLAMGWVEIPSSWRAGEGAMRFIGLITLVLGLAYIVASRYSRRRSWTLRGHTIELPGTRLAVVQSILGIANWGLIAGVLYVLFQNQVPYFEVLGILLISAIAGAAAHVPGGIGVTEYVFIAMLSPGIPRSDVLAVVLVYRLYYYIAPLLLAGLTYLIAEATLKSVEAVAPE